MHSANMIVVYNKNHYFIHRVLFKVLQDTLQHVHVLLQPFTSMRQATSGAITEHILNYVLV